MDGEQRREALLQMLGDAREPLSGSALARRLGVSRQVIVQISRSCGRPTGIFFPPPGDICSIILPVPIATAVLWCPTPHSRLRMN